MFASPRVPAAATTGAPPARPDTGCAPVLEIRNDKARVRAAWRARDFDTVVAIAGSLLDKAPQTPDIARMRVKALLKLARLTEAASAVIPLAGAEPKLALIVASALLKAREIEPAARIIAALRAAGETGSDSFALLQGKVAARLLAGGEAAERSGAQDKARAAFLLGLSAAPEDSALQRKVAGLRQAARAAAASADFEKDAPAYIAAWTAVLALDPNNVNAIKRLAVAAEKSGDHVAAMDLWGRALACDPPAVAAAARLARAALHGGKEYDALLLLERLKRLGDAGDYVEQLRRKATSAAKALLRNADGFGASYSIALVMRSGAADDEIRLLARKTMALLRAELKRALQNRDAAKAAAIGGRMLDIEPADALALSAVGRYAYLMRDFAAAATYYDRLTASEPSSARHWQALARARARAGDPEGARAAQTRAVALGASEGAPSSAPAAGKREVTAKISSWMRKR